MESASYDNVQRLLLRGKRNEAVDEAIASRDFSMALLVASMCDRETYQKAARQYAEQVFLQGSPLHTVAMLFSGQLQIPVDGSDTSHWGGSSKELVASWRYHLAAIISNRTVGWDRIVLSLGDRLKELGDVHASHFCYMVCGCPITGPTHQDARFCLLGCDHSVPMNLALQTEEAILAYERTEAYEWAKRLGNRNAAIQSLQPFKFIYAMMLVDLGYWEAAEHLFRSIRRCADLARAKTGSERNSRSLASLFENQDTFACALNELEYRLQFRKDPHYLYDIFCSKDQGREEKRHGAGLEPAENPTAQNVAIESISMAEEKQEHEETKGNVSGGSHSTKASLSLDAPKFAKPLHTESSRPKKSSTMVSMSEKARILDKESLVGELELARKNGTGAKMLESGVDTSFVSAKSNLLDVTGYSLDQEKSGSGGSESIEPQVETEKRLLQEHLRVATPKVDQQKQPPILDVTPKETKKPGSPPMSAPAVMVGKKSKEHSGNKPAPSSSGKSSNSWGLGIRGRMIKWLNPDAHQVTLEESTEKAYYDEKRKVWVFPGDNPDDLVKPIGPPPTIPASPATPGPSSSIAQSNATDPLAAMMAPPKRAPTSFKRPGTYASMPSPGVSTPLAAGTPPKFVVFTPVAAGKKEDTE